MAHRIGTAKVAVVVTKDAVGKKVTKETEAMGDIMQRKDGQIVIRAKRYYNYADLPGRDESNFFYISLDMPGQKLPKAQTPSREPGQEG